MSISQAWLASFGQSHSLERARHFLYE